MSVANKKQQMLNDLSHAREGRRLCREEWVFQQDNAAIHNASTTKRYLLEKIRIIGHARPLSNKNL